MGQLCGMMSELMNELMRVLLPRGETRGGPVAGYSSAGVALRAYAEYIDSTPDEVHVYMLWLGGLC